MSVLGEQHVQQSRRAEACAEGRHIYEMSGGRETYVGMLLTGRLTDAGSREQKEKREQRGEDMSILHLFLHGTSAYMRKSMRGQERHA